ncbi:hypothetical protein [Paenibacillus ferrarius]|uniref:hypothetical protein n=1 Tax=Paenibacillus ferrarius TaxID=1469647 RepID=UPI00117E5227|nr:hypothetical protein [Paenibacillus ferrarius]
MNNFIEVRSYEEASHLEILNNNYPDLNCLTIGNVYELKFGKVEEVFGDDEFHVIDDRGRRNAGIIAVKTRKLLLV